MARKMAARAPVATRWEMAMAALVGAEVGLETADADPEAEIESDEPVLDGEAEDSLELSPSMVALRVPHCLFFLQVSCPSASFGCDAMHWS